MPSRRRLLSAAVGTAALATFACSQALAAEVEWKFFTYFGANDMPAKLHRDFAEDVSKATGGKLKITVYAAGELPYKFNDVLRVVATDQVQMGDLGVGTYAAELPGLNVFDLPFLCTSFDAFFKAVPSVGPTVADAIREKYEVASLVHWTMPPQQIWLRQPIQQIDDLKGRKIRIWSKMHQSMLSKFGASSVTITSAEVTTALERGVADGGITAAIPAYDWKFYDVAKYGYMLNFHLSHQIVVVNQKRLDELPADVKQIVLQKSAEWLPRYKQAIVDGDREAREKLKAKGETLIDPSEADMKKARDVTRDIWDEWAGQNATAKGLLEKAKGACIG